MERVSELYEAFPADETTTVLAYGFLGGITGAAIFGLCGGILYSIPLLNTPSPLAMVSGLLLFILLVVFYYIFAGSIFFLVGIGVSRLIGHKIDLRLVAALSACCAVYAPLGILIWNTPFGKSASFLDMGIIGLEFGIPMAFVATGAWLAADREFQKLQLTPAKNGQFDLTLLFSATLILAAIMFVGTQLQIGVGFCVGFLVAISLASIVTAAVAWVQKKREASN